MTIPLTLEHRLAPLRDAGRFSSETLDAFANWIVEAPDEALFRVNPLAYAAERGLPERDAIDLFVHAARAGIFDFAWGCVCPSCLAFVSARAGLRGLASRRRCQACLLTAGDSLDEGVEVAFTVSPAVRRIRFHGGWSALIAKDRATVEEDVTRMYFSSAAADERLGDMFQGGIRGLAALAPGVTQRLTIEVDAAPEAAWMLVAPALHAVARVEISADGAAAAEVEIHEDRILPEVLRLRPGKAELAVSQRTGDPEVLFTVVRLVFPDIEPEEGPEPVARFLTGKRLLTTQSFRELFRAESLKPEDTLDIRALAMLFTDLKASTQMYERVGDLKALSLVREHFQLLRDVVAAHDGAVVKTIGDAVMATFADPVQATAAAIEMHRALHRARPDELQLKIGLHVGPCVAVDSNERLDYFGQTVNIAARVQNLAEGKEVVLTDAVLRSPGVTELLQQSQVAPARENAQLKGIDNAVVVHRATIS